MSTAPSATSMYDQKSPYALVRQTERIRSVNASSRPLFSHARSEAYDNDASARVATSLTRQGCADISARPVQAPSPYDAHQRRPSAGADTTPATTWSSTIRPIIVAHTGTPRM